MKTYLVTGGAGFIGANFIIYMLNNSDDVKILNFDKLTYAGNLENLSLVENDPRYAFIQGDVCDYQEVSNVFKQFDIDIVVNFAAESHVDRSISNPNIFADTNIMGTLNLLNAAKADWDRGDDVYKNGVKYLQVSTDEVYGSLGETGFFTESTPLNPHSPYSASKTSADLFVSAYYDTFRLPINITRCSNNYGRFQFPEKLIPLIINNALQHKDLPIYGDGLNVRDWLFVDDHCKAIDLVIRQGKEGEVYNVGGHNEQTNISIVKIILDYLHKNIDQSIGEHLIKYVEDRKGHDRRYGIDPTKICRDLGWEPDTNFKNGIIKTIEWYLDNKDWLKNVTSGEYREYYSLMYEKNFS